MAIFSTIPGIACVHTQQHMDSSLFVCVCVCGFFLRDFVNALSLSSTTHKKNFLHRLVNKISDGRLLLGKENWPLLLLPG